MIAFNWKTMMLGLLLVSLVVMGRLVSYYSGKYSDANEKLNSAQMVSKNAIAAINLMYDISKATHEAKQNLSGEGEKTVVIIREAVKGDECATRNVPDPATDNLRLLERSARSGKSSKD